MTVAVNDKFGLKEEISTNFTLLHSKLVLILPWWLTQGPSKVPWNGKHLLGSCTRSISIVPEPFYGARCSEGQPYATIQTVVLAFKPLAKIQNACRSARPDAYAGHSHGTSRRW